MTDKESRAKKAAYAREWRALHPGYQGQHPEWQQRSRAKHPERVQQESLKHGRLYKARHPDRHYATNRIWQEENIETKRLYAVYHKQKQGWGCTREFFQTLVPRLKGPCEICGKMERMHIDHCHEKKVFRGILCNECNHGIGNFKDNPDLLLKAIKYLEQCPKQ